MHQIYFIRFFFILEKIRGFTGNYSFPEVEEENLCQEEEEEEKLQR